MCNHRFIIEYRNKDDWQIKDTLHFSDRVGSAPKDLADAAHRKALSRAEELALAEPGRAREITVQYYDCNGPLSEAEQIYPNGIQFTGREVRLAQDRKKLIEALEKVTETENTKVACKCTGAHDPDMCLWPGIVIDGLEKAKQIAKEALDELA
jgi:hypothetical protein